MTDIQTKIYRAMSVDQKLRIAMQLRQTAWEVKAAGIRSQFPELAESEVQERVRQIFLNASS